MPFVLKINRKTDDLDMIAKTVMRKDNFLTRTNKLYV